MDLDVYMEQGIHAITKTVSRFYLKSKNGRHFILKFIPNLKRSEKIRRRYKEQGVNIPPFLIASITSECNLHCSGCYARADGMCGEVKKEEEMTNAHWEKIFRESENLGISFILLAGGEPLYKRELIKLAGTFKNIAFPIFTNGTLIDEEYSQIFDENRNLIPVLSIEGTGEETDLRRGEGVTEKIEKAMAEFKKKNILFAASITVTTQNFIAVSSNDYVSHLREEGCGIIFYVEYVPVEKGTENLVLSEPEIKFLDNNILKIKNEYTDLSLLSFPGDEKYMGGCLAGGRGFFHIDPIGKAEPCPFSPYSKMNLKENAIIEVIKSPFFKEIQKITGEEDHNGGCTLFRVEEKVKKLMES